MNDKTKRIILITVPSAAFSAVRLSSGLPDASAEIR